MTLHSNGIQTLTSNEVYSFQTNRLIALGFKYLTWIKDICEFYHNKGVHIVMLRVNYTAIELMYNKWNLTINKNI